MRRVCDNFSLSHVSFSLFEINWICKTNLIQNCHVDNQLSLSNIPLGITTKWALIVASLFSPVIMSSLSWWMILYLGLTWSLSLLSSLWSLSLSLFYNRTWLQAARERGRNGRERGKTRSVSLFVPPAPFSPHIPRTFPGSDLLCTGLLTYSSALIHYVVGLGASDERHALWCCTGTFLLLHTL